MKTKDIKDDKLKQIWNKPELISLNTKETYGGLDTGTKEDTWLVLDPS